MNLESLADCEYNEVNKAHFQFGILGTMGPMNQILLFIVSINYDNDC